MSFVPKGINQSELLPAHSEKRNQPNNMSIGDEGLFAHELERHWGPCTVVEIEHVAILGHTWLQWGNGRFADHYKPGPALRRRKRGRLKDLVQLRHKPQRIAHVLWVHDTWSGNYFHWLTDVLPKLQAWKESGEDCRTILLPQTLLNRLYVGDSLQSLGFEAISLHSPRLEIDRLTVIGPTAPTGNFRAGLLQRLRQDLLGEPSAASARKVIYISRADAAQRFLVNEAELVQVMTHIASKTPMKVVQLEGRSLEEQIQLFKGCSVLVALHGAGLTNMLWMPPGSQVVEIRRRGDSHNNCYFAMACALGHSYNYLQADDMIAGQTTCNARVRLDPLLLGALLKEVLPC